jgi:hypothetical protein
VDEGMAIVLPHTNCVHLCTDARNSLEKSHLVPHFGLSGARSIRHITVHMSFRYWEIDDDTLRDAPSRIPVARVPRKVSPGCGMMFTMVGNGWWEVMSG